MSFVKHGLVRCVLKRALNFLKLARSLPAISHRTTFSRSPQVSQFSIRQGFCFTTHRFLAPIQHRALEDGSQQGAHGPSPRIQR